MVRYCWDVTENHQRAGCAHTTSPDHNIDALKDSNFSPIYNLLVQVSFFKKKKCHASEMYPRYYVGHINGC